MKKRHNKNGFSILIFVFIFALILVVGVGFYYLNKRAKSSENLPEQKKSENFISEVLLQKTRSVFPDDYTLKPDEVPKGFQLAIVDESARRVAGITSNPGYITNQDLYKGLYGGIDLTKIKSVYGSVYVKPEAPQIELLIIILQYTSEEDFDKELQKLVSFQEGLIYLKGKDILVVIGSDTAEYSSQVREISDTLKKRLDLKDL